MTQSSFDENFFLRTSTARELYHTVAAKLPIIDYHCHLDPTDLTRDRRFENIAQLWVTGDPYKHRAMRIAGVPEQAITGDATDWEKFDQWAATVPQTIGNPLYHWTAMELKNYFGISEPLTAGTASRIWDECNRQLADSRNSARGLLLKAGVVCVCTSDRLLDDLASHASLQRAGVEPRVLPSLRSDDIVAVDGPEFLSWLQQLARKTEVKITDFGSYCANIRICLNEFSQNGCRLADHGLEDFAYEAASDSDVEALFARRIAGETLSVRETSQLKTAILRFLGREYARRNWIMQLHVGAERRTSSRLRRVAGPAGGYSGIGAGCDVRALIAWFDDLETQGGLPRTILYPLNPADFVPLAVLAGSFVENDVPGKIQLGPAWWFNDHAAGIRAQLDAVSSYGLLYTFIGMTTDSRNFLSIVRHDYFRRVLCDWIGDQVEKGAMPSDLSELGRLLRKICFENARDYLAL